MYSNAVADPDGCILLGGVRPPSRGKSNYYTRETPLCHVQAPWQRDSIVVSSRSSSLKGEQKSPMGTERLSDVSPITATAVRYPMWRCSAGL